jgi:hypothetical protein
MIFVKLGATFAWILGSLVSCGIFYLDYPKFPPLPVLLVCALLPLAFIFGFGGIIFQMWVDD